MFSAAGQLAADFVESQGNGRPTLGTEDADNYSIGVAVDVENWSFTLDYYNISVEDRIALGANIDFLAALNYAGGASYASVSDGLTQLGDSGAINRTDFVGLEDLKAVPFLH